MANHGYQTCSLCLLVMMMPERSSLKFSNQSLACLRDPSLIWFMDQLDQRPLRDMTDSSPFQCRSSLVLSIRWNRVVLRCRRCFPGVFSRHWWIFRLPAGDCPLARGYGGFNWVFDPGINRILTEEKDVFELEIGEITPLYLMGTKKNSQTHWIISHGPMPLSMFGEDEEHVSNLSVSNRKTKKSSKRRLKEFFAFMEFTQAGLVVSINIFCKKFQMAGCVFSVFVEDAKIRQFVTSSHLFVVATSNNMWDRNRWKLKSEYFGRTLIWCHRFHVNISDSYSEASDFSMRCALWSFSKEMLLTHTFHIREVSKMEKEIAKTCVEKRGISINQHQWVGRYRRHDPEPFQATYKSIRLIKVMRKAFRSFIYKMIAFHKYMKRGLNRFYLLPVRLLLESRVTSTSSSKLGFNFLYLFQWLYLNCIMYHVKHL